MATSDQPKFDLTLHIPSLTRYAKFLVRHLPASSHEDLLHDTILQALRKQHLYVDESGKLDKWLRTIMHNLFISSRRRSKLNPGLPITESEINRPAPERTDIRLLTRDLIKGLNQLTPNQHQIVLLRGYEDLSYDDIAKVLAIPVGTVRSRLTRGRRVLQGMDIL